MSRRMGIRTGWIGGIEFAAKDCNHDEEEYDMNTEEKSEKGEKATSGCCGFDGREMSAMMSACCANQDGSSGCATMMKDMMQKMKKQSCCAPTKEGPGQEEGKL